MGNTESFGKKDETEIETNYNEVISEEGNEPTNDEEGKADIIVEEEIKNWTPSKSQEDIKKEKNSKTSRTKNRSTKRESENEEKTKGKSGRRDSDNEDRDSETEQSSRAKSKRRNSGNEDDQMSQMSSGTSRIYLQELMWSSSKCCTL